MVASANIFAVLSNAAADGTVEIPSSEQNSKKKQQNTTTVPVVPPSNRDRATQSERLKRGTGYPARGGARRVVGTRASGSSEGYQAKSDSRSRGGPRHQHVAPRRGRQFDRHSGTGMVDSEKKEKQGWLGDENALVADGDKATEQAKKDQKQEGGEESAPVAAEEAEPEVVTLEDYLKKQEEEAASGAGEQKTLRKANEGTVDNSQMKGGSIAYAKEDEDFFAPVQLQKSRKQKERKGKAFVDIKQRFVDEQPNRGAFRGGPRDRNQPRRGGRASGGARQPRVNVNDERAFPSL